MRFLITEVTVCTATIISLAIIEFILVLVAVVISGGRCKHMKEYLSIVASFSRFCFHLYFLDNPAVPMEIFASIEFVSNLAYTF